MAEDQQPDTNQWDRVDDFKWLKSEPSPNWSVLLEDKRVPESVWTDVVGPDSDIDEVLRKVGVGALTASE